LTESANLKKLAISKSTGEKILATVPYDKGFHFFTSVGKYTGETAISLATFAREVEFVPVESLDFHFRRGDFQKWIAETIGDAELATKVGHIEKGLSGDRLRRQIVKIVNKHVNEVNSQVLCAKDPPSK